MPRGHVAHGDAARRQIAQKARDAGPFGPRVVFEGQPPPVIRQGQPAPGQIVGDRRQRLIQIDRQGLFAEIAHQVGGGLHQQQAALGDDADAVGHLLGLFQIMGGQDDRHALAAQIAHDLPHLAAQGHVDAGGRFVQKQHLGLVRQRLGDQHAALHAARQLTRGGVALVPQRQRPQDAFDIGLVRGHAVQPAGEADAVDDLFERLQRDLLGDQADQLARGAPVGADVVPAHADRATGRHHQPADDRDQRRLARPVGAQEGNDLSLVDGQGHVVQRLGAAAIFLGQMVDVDDRAHAPLL